MAGSRGKRERWGLCGGLALCLAGGPAGTAPSSGEEGIQFREAWGFAVIVPVQVAGAGLQDFLLDTGSAVTVVDPGLAAEIDAALSPSESILTLAGEQAAVATRVDLALGSWGLEQVEVQVAPLGAIQVDEPRVRGILGQSALKRLEYTIDHARRRLIVHRSEAVTASPGASRPILEARLGCRPSPSRLVLDSGVGTAVLFERPGRPLDLRLGEPVEALTNAGRAVWREARLPSFCVAGRRTGSLPVVVRPEAQPPRQEDGLLPTRFFARVRVGPAGAVVAVDFW